MELRFVVVLAGSGDADGDGFGGGPGSPFSNDDVGVFIAADGGLDTFSACFPLAAPGGIQPLGDVTSVMIATCGRRGNPSVSFSGCFRGWHWDPEIRRCRAVHFRKFARHFCSVSFLRFSH